MLSKNKISHIAGAIKNWTLNYRPWLLPGETLTSISMVSSSTTLLDANPEIFLGTQIKFQITGGVAGEVATITITITTSKTETKIDTLKVSVNAP